jgi:DDE superfamily endonuclease
MSEIDRLLDKSRSAFNQPKALKLARETAYGLLTSLGKKTISGMITSGGKQFLDWSAAYRLFSKGRVDTDGLFDVALEEILESLGPEQMIISHLDDTILKKTGKKIPGTGWRRDPLGPPFQTNFIWGQRFLQLSLALPDGKGACQSRGIPVDFHHCPTVKKPSKSSSADQLNDYKEQKKQAKLSKQGSLRIEYLRQRLDRLGAQERELYISVDGSYTNLTVIKNLPKRVTLIGRIRKDTRLHMLPEKNDTGRPKLYGPRIPTPEQVRQADQFPWQRVTAWAAGKTHDFRVKVIKNLRWEKAGGNHNLQLVIISPLGYRLTKKSKVLYRDPAYLICTDTDLNIEKLLQAYLWRWEIEVNFRDEKNIFGCGEAQVRTLNSIEKVPAFIAAVYSFLLLAAHKSCIKGDGGTRLPRSKWYPGKPEKRITTGDMLNLLKSQMWAKTLGCTFRGFVKQQHEIKSRQKVADPLSSSLFYMYN